MRSKKFFDDIFAGLQMFLKGKLGLTPSRIKGRDEVKEVVWEVAESRKWKAESLICFGARFSRRSKPIS